MEKSENLATYEFEPLPNNKWQARGKALVLAESVRHELVRSGLARLRYGEGSYGLVTLDGPSGVGKSVTARWAGDATVRAFGGIGNALVIETPALLSEHLGKSQQICAQLMKDIAVSGRQAFPTVCHMGRR